MAQAVAMTRVCRRRSDLFAYSLQARAGNSFPLIVGVGALRRRETFGTKAHTLAEQCPGNASEFCGERNHGLAKTASRPNGECPATQAILPSTCGAKSGFGRLHVEHPQVCIAAFGDVSEADLAAGGPLPGHQAHPGGELAAILEFSAVADRGDGGERRYRSDAQDLVEPLRRLALAREHS
jgi:hypothetical protein